MKNIIAFLILLTSLTQAQSVMLLFGSDGGTSIDTIPSQFTFTDVTDAALSSYNQAYIVVAGCDSARFYPASGDTIRAGALGTKTVSPIWLDEGDTLFTFNVASATNSTATHSIIYSSNGTPLDTFSVTTVAASACDAGLLPDSASCFATSGIGYWVSVGSSTRAWDADSLYMTVTSTGTDPWGVRSQDNLIDELTTYIVTFRAKSSNISARSINLGAGTVNSSTSPNLTTTFQNYTFDWTSGSEQFVLTLRIDDQGAVGTQYVIDDIKIVVKP